MPLRRALQAIARNRTRGAAELAAAAARALARDLGKARFRSPADAQAWARTVASMLLSAQPGMAPFYHLAGMLLMAAEDAAGEDPTVRLREAPLHFARDLKAQARESARLASDLVADGETVVTYSRSGSVLAVLRAAAELGKVWTLRVSEARPRAEGRSVARAALALGHRVEFFTDAGLFGAVEGAAGVLVGADAIGESRFRNKVGTAGLAHVARGAGVPFYVVADPFKILPERFWLPELPKPAREVWRARAKGLAVINLYFESVPLALGSGVVLGSGPAAVCTPEEVAGWHPREHLDAVERLLAGG